MVPSSRLEIPGDVFSVLLIAVLLALPFVVDSEGEHIDGWYQDRLE